MISVFMIDTVGAHRGMHYYNFPLTSELQNSGLEMTLISTRETAQNELRPANLSVLPGFKGIYGQVPKAIRGLRYAISLLQIARLAQRQRPQIVHFHFCQIPLLDHFFFQALGRLSIQLVITVHDVVPFEYGSNVKQARHSIWHKIYQNAAGLILNSTHAMQRLAELDESLLKKAVFIQQGAYTQAKPGTLTPTTKAKSLLGLEEGVPLVLVFGTIKSNKRLDLAIKAIGQMVKDLPEVHLLIAGQPQDRLVDSDIVLAKSLGIGKNVIWKLGRSTDEEMLTFFSAADVVLFPYQWIYQSAALLMAMSLGKAVVATAVGSNNDVIVDGQTGLLVPLDDVGETAVVLQKLLTNPQYAKQLAEAAQKDVDERFNWNAIAQETKQFYQQLLCREEK